MGSLEDPFFSGGVVVTRKTIYRVELRKTGALGQFADLREGAWKKEGNALYVDY